MAVGGIIVAAGGSRRMGGRDKLLQPLDGRPLVAYAIAAFAASSAVDVLTVVASAANREALSRLAADLAPGARVVLGGERRQDSVRAGLESLGQVDFVVVHDGARPLVTPELIEAALEGARQTGAAICAVPVADTIKRSDEDQLIRGTVSRENLWLAQTPQAFRYDLLARAHAEVTADVTDDAAMLEILGEPVRLVTGSSHNIKVTNPEDLHLARALLHSAGLEDE